MHDDVGGAHEHSALLCLLQVVLSHGHSVLPATTVSSQTEEGKAVMLQHNAFTFFFFLQTLNAGSTMSYLMQ